MTDGESHIASDPSARGRIADIAAANGWTEMYGDIASNVRIYERADLTILVGYMPSGSVNGASRLQTPDGVPVVKLDELLQRDRDKAAQVQAWLQEPA